MSSVRLPEPMAFDPEVDAELREDLTAARCSDDRYDLDRGLSSLRTELDAATNAAWESPAAHP